MNAADIVRQGMETLGVSQKQLATKIGLKTQQSVFNILNAKQGMRIDNFIKMMNVLGYDVMVKNRVTDETITVEVETCDTDMVE
jgi:antitoxin component HigA of HigAB toxin-antitoxin module